MLSSKVVTALNAACQQQPVSGKTISISGSLFSTTLTNITSPSATPTGTYTPSTGGLSLGAKIGIAIGGLLALLGTSGFCIVWNGKRRRRRVLRERQRASGFDDWRKQHNFGAGDDGPGGHAAASSGGPPMATAAGSYFDSPDSQRPLHPWAAGRSEDESPASPIGEKVYFSPYSSHYSSPVSASDQDMVIGREWPIDRKGSMSGPSAMDWAVDRKGSVGGNSARKLQGNRGRDAKAREDDGDRIEMQNVAPVLLHPGPGRVLPAGLTEEDARRGAAL